MRKNKKIYRIQIIALPIIYLYGELSIRPGGVRRTTAGLGSDGNARTLPPTITITNTERGQDRRSCVPEKRDLKNSFVRRVRRFFFRKISHERRYRINRTKMTDGRGRGRLNGTVRYCGIRYGGTFVVFFFFSSSVRFYRAKSKSPHPGGPSVYAATDQCRYVGERDCPRGPDRFVYLRRKIVKITATTPRCVVIEVTGVRPGGTCVRGAVYDERNRRRAALVDDGSERHLWPIARVKRSARPARHPLTTHRNPAWR